MSARFPVDELSFREYYGVMGIPEEKKRRRRELAGRLLDAFLFLFAYARRTKDAPGAREALSARGKEELSKALPTGLRDGSAVSDPYLLAWAASVAESVADTTLSRMESAWHSSYDRAWRLAASEANSVENYADFSEAKAAGAKSKTWRAMLDERVRGSHLAVDGETVPIDGYFRVGAYFMRFPHDVSLGAGPEEWVNCRCWVEYGESLLKNGIERGSGATYGGYNDDNDPYYENRSRIAGVLYEQIRNRKKDYEIRAVAKNAGFSEEDVGRVYSHVFEREHLLDDGIRTFDPDYYMAHSWLRLRDGKAIQPHDIVMLRHELAEEKIMGESLEIPYRIAHNEAEKEHNYRKALESYLANHDA